MYAIPKENYRNIIAIFHNKFLTDYSYSEQLTVHYKNGKQEKKNIFEDYDFSYFVSGFMESHRVTDTQKYFINGSMKDGTDFIIDIRSYSQLKEKLVIYSDTSFEWSFENIMKCIEYKNSSYENEINNLKSAIADLSLQIKELKNEKYI